MSRVKWDETGKRYFEAGVSKVVLYVYDTDNNTYGKGVGWNGITAVNEAPSGAEANAIWANNAKYANLMSAEDFAATIEAYTYPDEFAPCDGFAALDDGVVISQQKRKSFAFTYRTEIGSDTDELEAGYKIHIVYGALAAPSQRDRATLNDSPEALTMSWEVSTTPVQVEGYRPTAHVIVDSRKYTEEQMKALEDVLYGTDGDSEADPVVAATDPTLLLPEDVVDTLNGD